jgi:thioredoxin reductase (NADPH)
MPERDVVVAGAGVAGLTAALFAARQGHSTAVLAPAGAGGALLSIQEIEDFPAFPERIAGFELVPAIQEQAEEAGAEFDATSVTELQQRDDGWLVRTEDDEYLARTVIVATGTRPRRLGIPGEQEFEGKGLSHCASCDGALFRGATVAIAGGGDSGLLEALELTKHVAGVVLFERENELSGQATYQRRVRDSGAIAVRCRTLVEEVVGNGTVSALRVRDLATQAVEEVPARGLFVYVGREPETAFLQGVVDLDERGRVVVDAAMCTARRGLFAAGDVRTGSPGHGITAAGDGAAAAVAAGRFLRSA